MTRRLADRMKEMETMTSTMHADRVEPGDVGAPPPGPTAVFRDPVYGGDLRVEVAPFQFDDPRGLYGVGVYFLDGRGERVRGTVLRWDRGAGEDPRVIHWQAPGPDGPQRCV